MPNDVVMGKIEIPDSLKIKIFALDDLPKQWDKLGVNVQTQRFGTEFLVHGKFIGFKIPSTVSPFAFNLVLNPLHKDFEKVKFLGFEPFSLDERIKE
jgi:RES domain-containing protein